MEQAAQQPVTPLRFARHIVGMAILALASPYVWYGSERTLTWFSTWITPLVIAAIAFGVYALFFRKRAKAAWPKSFFILAWVFLGLAVASPYLESFNNRAVPQNSTQRAQPTPSEAQSVSTLAPAVLEAAPADTPTPLEGQPPAARTPTAAEIHLHKIYAAHPDADAIFESPGFRDWLSRTPKYQRIAKEGSAQDVIAMFSAYKRALAKPAEPWNAETVRRNEAAAEALARRYGGAP